ncbi:hypothetical protein EYF80_024079 [Liparis tanakae]|uniref:Uncharacterized protein n=1 Tax=Liparis tanakae TaxID=230148 RepID=A0A4Z2HK67_9TELE|nr:hypothetical protein EYF80_024079 [Liparis tanakae]
MEEEKQERRDRVVGAVKNKNDKPVSAVTETPSYILVMCDLLLLRQRLVRQGEGRFTPWW